MVVNDTTYAYKLRRELITQLVKTGYQVTVIAEILSYQKELEEIGCRLMDVQTGRHGTNVFQDVKLCWKYYGMIHECNPDLVLTFNIKPNIYAGLVCSMLKIPYLPNITGLGKPLGNPGLLQKLTTFLYKLGIGGASVVMFQNEGNEQFFREKKILPKKARTVLLPGSGVNLEQHSLEPYPSNAGDGKWIFLTIGRIMHDKGIDEVICAAKQIKQEYPNVVFRLIGDYDDNYEEVIQQAVAQGVIEYVGAAEDVHAEIKASHATIHASYHEGMSNVLLESAACGRPVIATDVYGCREIFEEGVSGFGCKARDVESLVKGIRRFINLPYAQKVQMGLAGRRKMEREFDRNIVIEKYLEEINGCKVGI